MFFPNSKENRLCGILSNPTNEKQKPIIILCNGFSTSKDGRSYLGLEKILNKYGISTFRFDFYGHGESDGKFEHITISEAVDDVQNAIQFLKESGYKRIGLVGSSFGGMASIIAAAQAKDLYILALKSPVSDYLGLLIVRDHNREIQTWKERGVIQVTGADGQSLNLNYSFFNDAEKITQRFTPKGD